MITIDQFRDKYLPEKRDCASCGAFEEDQAYGGSFRNGKCAEMIKRAIADVQIAIHKDSGDIKMTGPGFILYKEHLNCDVYKKALENESR